MMIFNINITKKYTNAKLEYMFSDLRAENYSMYDTWFKNKFNMSAKDIFKEHYNNFKPTLNQIEKFDVSSLKSSAYSANLAELKYQAAKTFTQADMKNLFSIPYNRDARLKYFTRYTT
jgi:RPA family protein